MQLHRSLLYASSMFSMALLVTSIIIKSISLPISHRSLLQHYISHSIRNIHSVVWIVMDFIFFRWFFVSIKYSFCFGHFGRRINDVEVCNRKTRKFARNFSIDLEVVKHPVENKILRLFNAIGCFFFRFLLRICHLNLMYISFQLKKKKEIFRWCW